MQLIKKEKNKKNCRITVASIILLQAFILGGCTSMNESVTMHKGIGVQQRCNYRGVVLTDLTKIKKNRVCMLQNGQGCTSEVQQ
jgi:hypothetical protein